MKHDATVEISIGDIYMLRQILLFVQEKIADPVCNGKCDKCQLSHKYNPDGNKERCSIDTLKVLIERAELAIMDDDDCEVPK